MIGWLRKKVVRRDAAPAASLLDTPAPAGGVEPRRSPEPLPFEAVAARAAEIWRRKGRPHGQDEQNWAEAEAELRAELADPRKPR